MSTRFTRWLSVAALIVPLAPGNVVAQATPQASAPRAETAKPRSESPRGRQDTSATVEVYGFAQADMIYDFGQNNPDWFDVNRPSRLPAFEGQFGNDGRTQFSVRQSRFGVRGNIPTSRSPVKVVFEFDLFGVGVDAGQTTIRPRHMYGQWGQFGAGQTNSVFMDADVFPNSVEYWGPNGMLFFRNVMVFWQPVNRPSGTRVTFSLERPGASGDAGVYADRIELQNVRPRFPAPDIAGEWRYGGGFGYVELAGMVRWIAWDDLLENDAFDLDGSVTGWGTALSTALNAGKNDVFRILGIYGAGVENYFNDAPIDVGLKSNFGDPITPVTGEALKNFGLSAFLDHRWSPSLTSALGYSRVDIDNSDLQAASAFKSGQYALVNLLWTPVRNVTIGGEMHWGQRDNNSDDFSFDDYRFQFTMKYSFSQKFGGNGNEGIRAQD
jgi:DcaP outer membrane protein